MFYSSWSTTFYYLRISVLFRKKSFKGDIPLKKLVYKFEIRVLKNAVQCGEKNIVCCQLKKKKTFNNVISIR